MLKCYNNQLFFFFKDKYQTCKSNDTQGSLACKHTKIRIILTFWSVKQLLQHLFCHLPDLLGFQVYSSCWCTNSDLCKPARVSACLSLRYCLCRAEVCHLARLLPMYHQIRTCKNIYPFLTCSFQGN